MINKASTNYNQYISNKDTNKNVSKNKKPSETNIIQRNDSDVVSLSKEELHDLSYKFASDEFKEFREESRRWWAEEGERESIIKERFFNGLQNLEWHSPGAFKAAIEERARIYDEMRDDFLENYRDDPKTLERRMRLLNHLFTGSFLSISFLPQPYEPLVFRTSKGTSRDIAAEEHVLRKNDNMLNTINLIQENIMRHTKNFARNFLENIQKSDFQTAFNASMGILLNDNESQSSENMSFSDILRIGDALTQWHDEHDDRGNFLGRMRRHESAFQNIIGNENISQTTREIIVNMLRA